MDVPFVIEIKDIIYTSGYLDADGCITIYNRNPTKNNHLKTSIAYPDIHISSINLEIIQYFKYLYGGCITKDMSQHVNPLYNWKPNISYMEEFLLLVQPYLKLKNKQAKIMIDFLKERKYSKRQKLTQEQVQIREKYLIEIQRLNKIR